MANCDAGNCTSDDALNRIVLRAAAAVGAEIAILSERGAAGFCCRARAGPRAGLIACETFCAAVFGDPRPLIIPDTRAHPLLRNNPNVVGPPHVGASISLPVLTSSMGAVGALCVMSTAPRAWDDADIVALEEFAHIAGALIDSGAMANAMHVARDGIAIADAGGVFTYMNLAHAVQFGYDHPSALIGKSWTILYDDTQAERIADEAFPMVAQSGVWAGEAIGRRRDGSAFMQEITLSALPSGGIICATRDISERKRLEAKTGRLAEMRARAEAASAAKSAFLAQMSHELRTPLNGIVGLAGALRETALSPGQEEIVALIGSCGETLERLVADILDLSCIEAGKTRFESSPFDLKSVVEDAVRIVGAAADAKRLRLEARFDGDGAFMGDAARIKQLLLNLLANAVKFTDAGGVRVSVTAPKNLAIGERGDIVIDVADTGMGFAEQDAARLFRRFEQGDETIARTHGGTGLGLSICQALTKGMGGTISCRSAIGAGSTFTVTLPLERAKAPLLVTPRAVTSKRGLRVLVAEDHATNRRVVEIILSAAGADLSFAANGFEATHARRMGNFDLVLMDMLMPVMSGLEAIAAIRALEQREGLPRIPIAVLSANVAAGQRELALRAGADLYLAKPITPVALLAGIETLLRADTKAA